MLTKLIRPFFYSNFYLGICAIALCIETNLLNHISLNVFPFYILIFFCTVIYYTTIYVRTVKAKNYNDRTIWYRINLAAVKKALTVSLALTALFLFFFLWRNFQAFLLLSPIQVILLLSFPIIATWYTFVPKILRLTTIRQIGWIKPFIVGLTWAGWVTVYPLLLWKVQTKTDPQVQLLSLSLLWLQDFLFFSINAIIFDVKDYRTDSYNRLKTYPVIFGIRNTFRFVLFPLIVINLVIFLLFQKQQNFSFLQTAIQLIPYLLLIFILVKYRHGRRVLYYLAAVDGLVFLKAFCGITSILLINK